VPKCNREGAGAQAEKPDLRLTAQVGGLGLRSMRFVAGRRRVGQRPRGIGMNFEDEELKVELDKIDPRDLCGVISLISTLFNVVWSTFHTLYTFDTLISVSFILGLLAILHKNSRFGKVSLVILGIHLAVIAALRTIA
jgi:hypothetical protein